MSPEDIQSKLNALEAQLLSPGRHANAPVIFFFVFEAVLIFFQVLGRFCDPHRFLLRQTRDVPRGISCWLLAYSRENRLLIIIDQALILPDDIN